MTVETTVKYAGYIDQQKRQIDRLGDQSDHRAIPEALEFARIPGISREVGERSNPCSTSDFGPGSSDSGRNSCCSSDTGRVSQCFT